jgi:hypothetical protein
MIGFDAFTVGAKRAMQSNNKRATRLSELVPIPSMGEVYGMAVSLTIYIIFRKSWGVGIFMDWWWIWTLGL